MENYIHEQTIFRYCLLALNSEFFALPPTVTHFKIVGCRNVVLRVCLVVTAALLR
jgi:hypothetical protein